MFAFLNSKVYSLSSKLVCKVLDFGVLTLITLYRAIGSLWLSGSCRFEPSCSVYAQEAVERYGFWVGGKLAIGRLGRCRPGGTAGFDPVPELSTGMVGKVDWEKK